MPCVSVVIPTYNAAHYLPATLASIQEQDFEDFEIIVVDDCSTDNTAGVVKRLNYTNLRYFCLDKNHGGPSRARNRGIQEAKGEFIAFCDSDDLFVPGRLSLAVKFLRNCPELGMVFTDEQKFDDTTGEILGNFLHGYEKFHSLQKKNIKNNWFVISSEDAYSCLFLENYIMPSGVTIRLDVLKIVGLFDEKLLNADDWDMWFRITKQFPIGFIKSIGFKYRLRSNSISRRGVSLALNRLAVLNKQMDGSLPSSLKKICEEKIAEHYCGIAYHYRIGGELAKAKSSYIQSLNFNLTWTAIKGLMLSMLG